MVRYYQLYADVIIAAFTCGTSRIAVINSGETWSTQHPGLCCDWHQLVAHEAWQPSGAQQAILVDAKRLFFESVFVYLASELDAVTEGDGVTMLDNTLMFWTQEAGTTTHDQIALPVIAAGSAAGVLETGRYVDYRNRQNMALANDTFPESSLHRPGLPYNRWLASALQAMGVPPSEFEEPGERGYGLTTNMNTNAWPTALAADMSDMLPRLARGT
jgi:hypothetical protein